MPATDREIDAQPDLFTANGRGGPPIVEERLQLFLRTLRGLGWVRCARLEQVLGLNERQIRRLAELAGGRVISGQRGYRLTVEATGEECAHAERWLHSQARQMTARAIAIRRVRAGGVH